MTSQLNSSIKQIENEHSGFGFWQKWLTGVTILYMVFGLLFAFFSNTILFDWFTGRVYGIFFATGLPEGLLPFQGWLYGLFGSILVGWSINMFFIAQHAFKRQEKWAWNALFYGMVLWYVLDSFISLQFGVGFNVVSNTAFLVAGVTPLIFTRKYF